MGAFMNSGLADQVGGQMGMGGGKSGAPADGQQQGPGDGYQPGFGFQSASNMAQPNGQPAPQQQPQGLPTPGQGGGKAIDPRTGLPPYVTVGMPGDIPGTSDPRPQPQPQGPQMGFGMPSTQPVQQPLPNANPNAFGNIMSSDGNPLQYMQTPSAYQQAQSPMQQPPVNRFMPPNAPGVRSRIGAGGQQQTIAPTTRTRAPASSSLRTGIITKR
jgi:hypothetical protein